MIHKIKKDISYNPKTGEFRKRDTDKLLGGKNGNGYHMFYYQGKRFYGHRVAWEIMFGEIPKGWEVDHIDGDVGNNTIDNLRCVPHNQNLRNQRKRNTNTSGHMGVYKHPYGEGRYTARIKVNGKFLHLGVYNSFEEAVARRKQAEQEFGFHPNHGH